MKKPTPKTTPKRSREGALYLELPPDERRRLVDYAAKVRRTKGWIVRDALAVYLDAVEPLDAKVTLDTRAIGQTPIPKRGRRPNVR